MYELFIANKNYSSWSLRPWVLLRQLGLPFQEHLHPFATGPNWAAFRAFSPTGKVPCLHDAGDVVWDSLAIAEYLAERHAGVWPERAEARAWARCAAAEMHAGFAELREVCSMNCGLRVQLHDQALTRIQPDLTRLDELWRQGLTRFGGPFLAGPAFTAVDAFYAPVAFRIQTFGLTLSPLAQAYAQRLLALPAMQQWYEAALAEPWREPGHDEASLMYGSLLDDLRVNPG
ncbi:MAG: glutathione S-transferase family protein [Aquabacterium sp.]|nr:glutathione S-transferase family protein [Aquabacterium sp.]